MTKLIENLTPEQKARFPEFVEKWTRIGLSTEPADRPKAEAAIKQMYAAAGLKPPRIVWCTSPLANGLTRAIILKGKLGGGGKGASVWASVRASVRDSVWASVGDSVGDSVWASVRDSVWASVRASVGASVGDSVRASVGASVGDSVWASVRDSVRASVRASVWASVRASVRASVWDSVRDSVWASVWDSVRDSVWASVRDSVGASVWDSVRDSGYGQHDANWLGFIDYFRDVLNLVTQTEKFLGLSEQAKAAGWYLPHKQICWVAERHSALHLKNKRLHCESGPAVAYPDGWGVFALNGIRMNPEYVMTPADKLTPEIVLKERSVDQRRELIRKIGVVRLIDQGKVKDTMGDYKLVDMAPIFTGIRYAPHLLMRNPSLDDTWHLEGVAPLCQTVQEALNWRAGNIEVKWSPALLS